MALLAWDLSSASFHDEYSTRVLQTNETHFTSAILPYAIQN